MISQDTIQQVKSSVSTLDIVGSFIKLKKKGVDYVGLCPFHNEKTPSFTISPAKNIYKCFGCGKSGDGITFLMQNQSLNYIEALKWVANKNNITIEEVGIKKEIQKPLPRLEKLSKETIDWFENKRSISNMTLLRFKVTEAIEFMPKAKSEVKTICFNYYKNDELINIKFRAKNKDFKMSKNAELIFYNLDAIKNEDTCYITEGELDCMSLYEIGIYNAVSVPNGASATKNAQLEYLDNCFEYFLEKKRVVLVTDNDSAGKNLEEELARRIGYEKCFIVKYPDGCKDANEVLIKYGKSELEKMLLNVIAYPLYGEIRMDDMYETIVDFYENGYPEGYASNVSSEFDEHLKFYPGQLTIITGIPGCFYKDQLVHTSLGVKPISEIKNGDLVLSYNHKKSINEYRSVTNTVSHKKHTDKLYKIKLKDGTVIKVTENHKFFTGTDYVKIKNILLPLKNGKMEKNT